MPGEQQAEEEEEEEMQEEMVLLVKGEEEEGEEKYEVVKLKIPMDNKELPRLGGAGLPLADHCSLGCSFCSSSQPSEGAF
ncbi:zinc finger protein 771 isoform X2 [Echinops telfairi]|uniref:Zinc finger protein 771 isoform X2 n=1 Tax=Echinops telfairi TaxID=9371 RepID=A0AC55CNT4_ECHTE|nr:zinc finger protein 771 isoform X2 [Echinops telfairi]